MGVELGVTAGIPDPVAPLCCTGTGASFVADPNGNVLGPSEPEQGVSINGRLAARRISVETEAARANRDL